MFRTFFFTTIYREGDPTSGFGVSAAAQPTSNHVETTTNNEIKKIPWKSKATKLN